MVKTYERGDADHENPQGGKLEKEVVVLEESYNSSDSERKNEGDTSWGENEEKGKKVSA